MNRDQVTTILGSVTGHEIKVLEIIPVSGGSINEAFHVRTDTKDYFIKRNSSDLYPGMFGAEAKGLHLLSTKSTFKIPDVIGQIEQENHAYLILDFLNDTEGSGDSWYQAGASLGQLHKNKEEHFGLDHNNFIGSLKQDNSPCSSWSEFLLEMRFEPMIKLLTDAGRLRHSTVPGKLRNLGKRADEIFPAEKASLLHGDLWNGNFMFSPDGPSMFDPAVYYGHRETDLAMTRLFGGFPNEFYKGYLEEYPTEKNWEKRIPLAQIYPLLVHAVLFGDSYLWQVNTILKPY